MGHIFDLDSPAVVVRDSSSSFVPNWSERPLSLSPRERARVRGKGALARPQLTKHSAAFPKNRLRSQNNTIGNDTPIVPIAVANSVWLEASFWLGEELPLQWIADLAERAETIYSHNPRFRKLLRRHGNAGRDWLWAFTRHWLSGLLIEHRPSLADRLPSEYKVGKPLSR